MRGPLRNFFEKSNFFQKRLKTCKSCFTPIYSSEKILFWRFGEPKLHLRKTWKIFNVWQIAQFALLTMTMSNRYVGYAVDTSFFVFSRCFEYFHYKFYSYLLLLRNFFGSRIIQHPTQFQGGSVFFLLIFDIIYVSHITQGLGLSSLVDEDDDQIVFRLLWGRIWSLFWNFHYSFIFIYIKFIRVSHELNRYFVQFDPIWPYWVISPPYSKNSKMLQTAYAIV